MGGLTKALKKAADPLGIVNNTSNASTSSAGNTAATDITAPPETKNDKDSDSGASDAVKRKRGKTALKIPTATGANPAGSGTGVNV